MVLPGVGDLAKAQPSLAENRLGAVVGAGLPGWAVGVMLGGYFLRGPKMRRASRRMRAMVAPVVILP